MICFPGTQISAEIVSTNNLILDITLDEIQSSEIGI